MAKTPSQLEAIAFRLTSNLRPKIDKNSKPVSQEQKRKRESINITGEALIFVETIRDLFYSSIMECAQDYALQRKSKLLEVKDVRNAYRELFQD